MWLLSRSMRSAVYSNLVPYAFTGLLLFLEFWRYTFSGRTGWGLSVEGPVIGSLGRNSAAQV